jgi:hypothetical protein
LCANRNRPTLCDIWNAFEEAVTASIYYVDNSYNSSSRQLVLAKASIYLAVANSLLPKGLQENNNTKRNNSSNIPLHLKELALQSIL